MRRLFAALVAMLLSATAFAQGGNLSGEVKDAQGEPIIGATVMVKGTQTGVVTNYDGQFTLAATPGSTLVVSYIGYKSQEVRATANMSIILEEDAQTLQDVVVIGYGVQKKSVVTASIAKVSADDLDGKTRLRAEDALKGMAAGVQVTSASGQPGA